jgi:serine/threonine-protein kinase
LQALETLLAPYVGPVARILVRKAAKTTTDGLALVRALAASIASERDGEAFAGTALERIGARPRSEAEPERSSPSIAPKPIEPVDVEKAASRLAPFVGPIAKIMAKKAAAQASDLRTFYRQLAENLPDAGERTEFLKKSGYRE